MYIYIHLVYVHGLYLQDHDREIVTLFFSRDNPVDKLQLQLIDYSSVLLDCLEGAC